jgi:hypothetical protein
MFVTVALEV